MAVDREMPMEFVVETPLLIESVTGASCKTPLNSTQVTMTSVGVPEKVMVIGLVVPPLGTISAYMKASKVTAEEDSDSDVTSNREFEAWSFTDDTVTELGVTVKDTTIRSPTVGWVPNVHPYEDVSIVPATS
jgi:hypothetical protein